MGNDNIILRYLRKLDEKTSGLETILDQMAADIPVLKGQVPGCAKVEIRQNGENCSDCSECSCCEGLADRLTEPREAAEEPTR